MDRAISRKILLYNRSLALFLFSLADFSCSVLFVPRHACRVSNRTYRYHAIARKGQTLCHAPSYRRRIQRDNTDTHRLQQRTRNNRRSSVAPLNINRLDGATGEQTCGLVKTCCDIHICTPGCAGDVALPPVWRRRPLPTPLPASLSRASTSSHVAPPLKHPASRHSAPLDDGSAHALRRGPWTASLI